MEGGGGYLVAGGRGGGRRERGVEPRLGDADPPVEVVGGSDRVLDEIVPAKEVAELVGLGDGEASDGGAEAAEGEEVREGEAAQGDEGPRLQVLVDLLSGRRAVRSCQGNAAPFACTEGAGGWGLCIIRAWQLLPRVEEQDAVVTWKSCLSVTTEPVLSSV